MKPSIELAKRAIAGEKAFAVYFPDPAKDMAEFASAVMAEEGIRYWISPGGDSITCTKCRNTSNNPNDVAKRYCGACHVFHGDSVPEVPSEARRALYTFESIGTETLQLLRKAHEADQAQASDPDTIVFCGGRLALIAEALKRRQTK